MEMKHDAKNTNKTRKRVVFELGDWVWVHLRKMRFPSLRESKLQPMGDYPFSILNSQSQSHNLHTKVHNLNSQTKTIINSKSHNLHTKVTIYKLKLSLINNHKVTIYILNFTISILKLKPFTIQKVPSTIHTRLLVHNLKQKILYN